LSLEISQQFAFNLNHCRLCQERHEAKEAFNLPYRSIAKIECTESKQRLIVPISGFGYEPLFTFAPDTFQFGECNMIDLRAIEVHVLTILVRSCVRASRHPLRAEQ